jgi:hypothetical protein
VASKTTTATRSESTVKVDADVILKRYQEPNLPRLAELPTPDAAATWAKQMQSLRSTELQKDLDTVAAGRANGTLNAADADRVSRWIGGLYQEQISRKIEQQIALTDGRIFDAMLAAKGVARITDSDRNAARNFANAVNGPANAKRLANGLRAVTVAMEFDRIFERSEPPDRTQQVQQLANAQQRLQELSVIAAEVEVAAKTYAKAHPKTRSKPKEILPSLVQKYWMNGSIIAELDRKGGIWVNSNEVGHITNTGKIWVDSVERGSLEEDGGVWFDGNKVGELASDGRVWNYISNTQPGSIDSNGKVWSGTDSGEITGFAGEWKRAAIVYFFPFFRG